MKIIFCPVCKNRTPINEEVDYCDGCDRYVCPLCSIALPENTDAPIDMLLCKDCYEGKN